MASLLGQLLGAQGPGAGAPAAGDQPQQQRQHPVWGLLRMAAMWYVVRLFVGGGKKPEALPRGEQLQPQFARLTPFDLSVFLSESAVLSGHSSPIWREASVGLADPKLSRNTTYVYRPSPAVQNNGSLFLHAVFHPPGSAFNPAAVDYDRSRVFAKTFMLTAYLPRPKNRTGVNLLSTEAERAAAQREDAEQASKPREIISYLRTNVSLAVLDEFKAYPAKTVPEHLRAAMQPDFGTMTYAPLVWMNTFWQLRDQLGPMNASVAAVTLRLDVHSLASWKYMLYHQMDHSFSMQKSMGAMAEGESDEFKRVLLEGNPVFLAITFSVSLLHSVFDALAFKNDIGFWKNKRNLEGLSVRTLLINCFCQVVIFLYLLDNDTSMLILISSGFGLLLEFWKVTKAMHVSVDFSGRFPTLKLADKDSYVESKTQAYDRQAMRYLSYVLYPLVAGYAVYALVYERHRSWYSWALSSLVGAVYAFGFILMCPQLYLNYKLKSVAHLPWRQMTYKFLNTIIDDLFAFVIKMPTLHRLSVFRDDLVFLVYLYQRWAYRVDPKRANEFGKGSGKALLRGSDGGCSFSAEEPKEEGAAKAALEGVNGEAAPAGTVAAAGGSQGPGRPQEGDVRRRGKGGAKEGVPPAAPLPEEGRQGKKAT